MACLNTASILMFSCCLLSGAASAAPPASMALAYDVSEGLNINRFLRQDQDAAHLVLRSGNAPRVLVAFPAGNSGVGVWFESVPLAAHWHTSGALRAVEQSDERGRPLRGIVAEASIDVPQLQVRQAVLSSVRVLRDYQALGRLDANLEAAPSVNAQARTITWSRQRLDGAVSYRLVLGILSGTLQGTHIKAGADGRIGLRITALTGETPLTPLAGEALLNDAAAADLNARHALSFLAYREKLLAGSWRFDTYFGRDTLMSVRMLMPVLSATAVEAALSSVLSRLSPLGEVAHEEDIGERAVLDHMQSDGSRSATPVYDYKMIDGNYLLAPIAAAWLLDDARAQPRAAEFLQAPVQSVGAGSGSNGAALLENLRLVVHSSAGFALQPTTTHLIGLKAGVPVGEWRDSQTGLGGGRYPYDVNAVLVPAALEAAARLYQSKLLERYQSADDAALFEQAERMARAWRTHAPALFDVSVGHEAAAQAVGRYAASLGVPAQRALAALGRGALHFHALALAAGGEPIAVMNSDFGFELLFGQPDAAHLGREVEALLRPFPSGLMTDAGMLVANPAFCAAPLQAQFNRNAYHGTVIWSWQQAMFAAGLARQLQRADLPAEVRTQLLRAQGLLWGAITATRAMNNSELWSWSFANDRYQVAPFGAASIDADESNAAQLWSTVYLAVRPPHEHH
jgi:hypothetical protein